MFASHPRRIRRKSKAFRKRKHSVIRRWPRYGAIRSAKCDFTHCRCNIIEVITDITSATRKSYYFHTAQSKSRGAAEKAICNSKLPR